MIEVVAGVIVNGGRILLAQRPEPKDFSFTWESPGGKVEQGEHPHDALAREVEEELGLRVVYVTIDPIWSGVFENPVSRPDRAQVRVTFYNVAAAMGRPHGREGQGWGWFTTAEMRALTLSPANARALEAIAKVF